MLFNSAVFLIFFAIFWVVWQLVRTNATARWSWLTFASMVFYGYWDIRFLFLIVATGLNDYFAGLAIERYPHTKKLWLTLSLIGNLGTLAFFKYSNFLVENLNVLREAIGAPVIPHLDIMLPVGISFYTFQSLSYTIDVYKGEFKPIRNILHFFAFLMMFPQLVAGPIVRGKSLLPKMVDTPRVSPLAAWHGTRLIVRGYFKKMVIADNLAPIVDAAFGRDVSSGGSAHWWLMTVLFAAQIYCDFSGYSDIARGLAKWLGYDFAVNFNHPYSAQSFRAFWQRWHMSLSTWFRDYVYIPLGGSRRGVIYSLGAMWVTMVVSGIWHGASWAFVIWGGSHAAFLTIERLTNWPAAIMRVAGPIFGKLVCNAIVLFGVLLAWVYFRAQNASQATQIVASMLSFDLSGLRATIEPIKAECVLVALVGLRGLLILFGVDRLHFWRRPWALAFEPLQLAVLVACSVYFRGTGHNFVYFQF